MYPYYCNTCSCVLSHLPVTSQVVCYGLFTLPDWDSGTDSDSDKFQTQRLHYTMQNMFTLDLDPQSLLYPYLGRISVPDWD